MKGLRDLLGCAEGRARLAQAGLSVEADPFLAALPIGRPARIYVHQQPAADPRRSVMAKLDALSGLWRRWPERVEPAFLRIDTDRAASSRTAVRIAWEGGSGRRHLKLTQPGSDRVESRHLQLDPPTLAEVARRLEAYIRQQPAGTREALARLERIRPLLAPAEPLSHARHAAQLGDFLMAERYGTPLPAIFVSSLAGDGTLAPVLARLLAGRDRFILAFNQAVRAQRAAGIETAVANLPADYLPLFLSCPVDGERLRLRCALDGRRELAVCISAAGRRYAFPLDDGRGLPDELLATGRWSPDVTLPILLAGRFDGVVAGRSSALYLMVFAAAMREALGLRPVPVLVPAGLADLPAGPDGLLQRWLMG